MSLERLKIEKPAEVILGPDGHVLPPLLHEFTTDKLHMKKKTRSKVEEHLIQDCDGTCQHRIDEQVAAMEEDANKGKRAQVPVHDRE